MELHTLTGLTIDELLVRLDEELPSDAYSPVPGSPDLTDIDAGFMRKVLTKCFGLCGVGWGYMYDPVNLHLNQFDRPCVSLTELVFWYVMVDARGERQRYEIQATGGSENRNLAFAMKGAVTNAIGHAVSNLGFQESVYLGRRSHRLLDSTTEGSLPLRTGSQANEVEPHEPVEETLVRGVSPKHNGKRLGELSEAALAYYANLDGSGAFHPVDMAGKQLQERARRLIEKRSIAATV